MLPTRSTDAVPLAWQKAKRTISNSKQLLVLLGFATAFVMVATVGFVMGDAVSTTNQRNNLSVQAMAQNWEAKIASGPEIVSTTKHNMTSNIRTFTRKCESKVQDACAKSGGICDKFCDKQFANWHLAALREDCKKSCRKPAEEDKKKETRCTAKFAGVSAISALSGNEPLDKQTADQLAQCIAELRDPDNTKSDRRKIHWKNIITPSWAKFLNVSKKLDIDD